MTLSSMASLPIIERSLATAGGGQWALADSPTGPRLVVAIPGHLQPTWFAGLEGEASEHGAARLLLGPLSAANAAVLRSQLTWLQPAPIGLKASAGMGDRLGLATPGHVRAMRAVGGTLAPIFAQQSIREMTRTGRSPQQVVDDATWGAFREGWSGAVGADADHIKNTADADRCLAAGFTLFTVDPGEHVRDVNRPASELREAFGALPWAELEDCEADARQRYVGRTFDAEGQLIRFDEATLQTAAIKYGHAVLHVGRVYRHIARSARPGTFELEVSVDETDAPTTAAEHVWVATELKRLGVRWVSLAPRFVGRFEKGVDYQGDLAEFERQFAQHAAIARHVGPYKISIHSGSDKFLIYPIAAKYTQGLVHLKTAGTSYLEAIRVIAKRDAALFREIMQFAIDRYETDKASYHVSAELGKVAKLAGVADAQLPSYLDDFHARQVLHVTFGSVLT
ncbi:MAG: tagaturonate epimerase family protein, partial [Bacteroidales bacterium]